MWQGTRWWGQAHPAREGSSFPHTDAVAPTCTFGSISRLTGRHLPVRPKLTQHAWPLTKICRGGMFREYWVGCNSASEVTGSTRCQISWCSSGYQQSPEPRIKPTISSARRSQRSLFGSAEELCKRWDAPNQHMGSDEVVLNFQQLSGRHRL